MTTINKEILRGRVRFPTGGIVRDPLRRLIWCDSITDSKVWMREEKRFEAVKNKQLLRFLYNQSPRICFAYGVFSWNFLLKRKGEMKMSTNTNVAGNAGSRSNLRTMVQIGMLGAVSVILMMFEIPLWFAPAFYKIDLSEVPVLIGTFAMGPVAGALIELVKIILHLVFKGTSTAGVGDFANFLIGCAFVIPAGIIYNKKKTRKRAVIGMVTGAVFMIIAGCFLNAFVLLPVYAKAFGMPMDALIGMGTAVNPAITNLTTFAVLAVAPFNLLKALIVSVITLLLYKYISPILKGDKM